MVLFFSIKVPHSYFFTFWSFRHLCFFFVLSLIVILELLTLCQNNQEPAAALIPMLLPAVLSTVIKKVGDIQKRLQTEFEEGVQFWETTVSLTSFNSPNKGFKIKGSKTVNSLFQKLVLFSLHLRNETKLKSNFFFPAFQDLFFVFFFSHWQKRILFCPCSFFFVT
jgi:hypothetical protein